jgi:L,D-transpeptidase YbiS
MLIQEDTQCAGKISIQFFLKAFLFGILIFLIIFSTISFHAILLKRKSSILQQELIKKELICLKEQNEKLLNIIKEKDARIKEIKKLSKEKEIKKILSFFEAVDGETELSRTDKLYVVISLSQNKLFIKRKGEILNEFIVSLGSGKVLKTQQRKWIFETPRGVFEVIDKKENPVWIKPDWAFIEKNEPIPPPNSPKRIVKGYLGKYGIYLSKQGIFEGYIIHGTPEEDLIGLNVSHGCIRMKEEDLKELYNSVEIGTKVIIR